MRFQRDAVICTSANYSAVTPTCSGSTDWTEGWIVWVDKDRDLIVDAAEVIAVQEPLDGNTSFTATVADRFTYDAAFGNGKDD